MGRRHVGSGWSGVCLVDAFHGMSDRMHPFSVSLDIFYGIAIVEMRLIHERVLAL